MHHRNFVSAKPHLIEKCPQNVSSHATPGGNAVSFGPSGYVLSVLIPVYNERHTLLELLGRVRDVSVPKQIVLVDDCSTDGTRQLLQEKVEGRFADVSVRYHERNRGKGAAIRTAIEAASGDYVIVQDADLEYDPKEYYQLLEPLLDGRADVVFGSRFLGGGPHRVCFFWHRVANGLLTFYSNVCTNLNLTDMEVCYKVFRREVVQSLTLKCDRFDFEPEVTAKVAVGAIRRRAANVACTRCRSVIRAGTTRKVRRSASRTRLPPPGLSPSTSSPIESLKDCSWFRVGLRRDVWSKIWHSQLVLGRPPEDRLCRRTGTLLTDNAHGGTLP
jgi:glycosyltransferase involved in cell wall biosynthesis